MVDRSKTNGGIVDDTTIINYITGYGTRKECSYDLLKNQLGENFENNIQRVLENGKVVGFTKQGKYYYKVNNLIT